MVVLVLRGDDLADLRRLGLKEDHLALPFKNFMKSAVSI